MDVKIRKATTEDAEILKVLYPGLIKESPDAFVDTYEKESSKTTEDWEDRINREELLFFVAEMDGVYVGMGELEYEENEENIPCVGKLGVLSEFRNQGIGKVLALEIEKYARENGSNKIRLYVIADQDKAIDFYKKIGFEVIEIKKGDIKRYDGTWQDVILMEKEL